MLTRSRKFAFGLLTTVLILGFFEGAARVYSAVRFHNARAFTHGLPFLRGVLFGAVQAPATEDWPTLQRATDELYARRSTWDGGPTVPAHSLTISGGRIAHLNSLGLRGPEITPEPATGSKRIATFGGSYVFGDLLEDDETWPFVLGTLLHGRGLPVEVVNGGGNGNNIHHVLQAVLRFTRRARADYLLVTSAYNNHPLLPLERRVRATVARRLDGVLYNLSMFHVLLKEKLGRVRGEPLDYGLYRERTAVDPEALRLWVEMYRTRLAQLATICREQGATLILASQPEVFYDARLNALSVLDAGAVEAIGQRLAQHEIIWTQELEYYLQGRLNLEAQRFAHESPGVLFFDGARVLEADKEKYFLDVIHPGPEGAATLAEALADFFAGIVGAAGGATH